MNAHHYFIRDKNLKVHRSYCTMLKTGELAKILVSLAQLGFNLLNLIKGHLKVGW